MATYYRWRKCERDYDLNHSNNDGGERHHFSTGIDSVRLYRTDELINNHDGTFDFVQKNDYVDIPLSDIFIGNSMSSDDDSAVVFDYFPDTVMSPLGDKTYSANNWFSFATSNLKEAQAFRITPTTKIFLQLFQGEYLFRTKDTWTFLQIVDAPGDFIEYVYSTNSSAYPNGGVSGEYYYNQRTTVTSPTAPSDLSYPATITTPNVDVTWTAATSNTSYPVSGYQVDVSTNGGSSWTTAGTPTTNSLSYSITPGVTSIMFRVRAKDNNGNWGDYVTGTASQVILAPTLTVPQMLMQGQQATVNWTAIEGADSYTLQRKSSADADWTQVYSGANTTFSETAGTWTTVQYRVQAVFDGTPGGWATSAEIPVVSASALVISGQDGDLGTLVNDVPYSISTDTGNQITATITANGAVIFNGNVGNSTAGVIPVLDLINGAGTIVIEASVTASSGPVSAVRTWTYTKTMMTFPNAGSIAELTKDGKVMWPETLAEAVRIPGGKTLDQVMGFPCQIYTGSYVGTGTYGQSNPNELTFPFKPNAVFISPGESYGMVVSPVWVYGMTYTASTWGQAGTYNIKLTWAENGVTWYCENSDAGQFNREDIPYYYVAIG